MRGDREDMAMQGRVLGEQGQMKTGWVLSKGVELKITDWMPERLGENCKHPRGLAPEEQTTPWDRSGRVLLRVNIPEGKLKL